MQNLLAAPEISENLFACDRLSARLTQAGCARRWEDAHLHSNAKNDALLPCRGCPLGAKHAGKPHVAYSAMYGASICPRCRKGTSRMIYNRTCVSCRNREYEAKTGRNSRGNKPIEVMQRLPRPHTFTVIRDGVVHRRVEYGVDMLEPMLQAMRTTRGALVFGFAGTGWRSAQGRLL